MNSDFEELKRQIGAFRDSDLSTKQGCGQFVEILKSFRGKFIEVFGIEKEVMLSEDIALQGDYAILKQVLFLCGQLDEPLKLERWSSRRKELGEKVLASYEEGCVNFRYLVNFLAFEVCIGRRKPGACRRWMEDKIKGYCSWKKLEGGGPFFIPNVFVEKKGETFFDVINYFFILWDFMIYMEDEVLIDDEVLFLKHGIKTRWLVGRLLYLLRRLEEGIAITSFLICQQELEERA